MLAASVTAPLRPSLSTGHRLESRIECSSRCGSVRIPTWIRPRELGLQSQPSVGRSRKQSSSIACTATALNATCSASGQTQTVTREAPTITQAHVHSKEKSP
ncbi:hypothetical protein ES319_1Z071300v1 [Gossypium barbadense]|uniref:Uncharacterized protein n=2 Tax=Gossypium TaxID=3633 RepID=A0A5J5NB08_GOSBA|nr:uncharacterized protein LOC105775702 isoform X2 [Gossypium raimondii]KAB1669141.1 hypothetical protein ES319_1Z071300v1 [Gossypium barbadense]TYG81877.1 hypothetical protein ES288_D01G040700v1 [Gossypium darwinii]KAB1669144.1 hypothetical protein ES319_1Z071300v1 [Gossypium barbadense]KAB1669145.1 hypothetical protein ES319_1Z071300v1 [Gossypium barbadense]KAB1669148.1 hypothetical protein ES319_1Z071300v1 [Gossypium barbadense]